MLGHPVNSRKTRSTNKNPHYRARWPQCWQQERSLSARQCAILLPHQPSWHKSHTTYLETPSQHVDERHTITRSSPCAFIRGYTWRHKCAATSEQRGPVILLSKWKHNIFGILLPPQKYYLIKIFNFWGDLVDISDKSPTLAWRSSNGSGQYTCIYICCLIYPAGILCSSKAAPESFENAETACVSRRALQIPQCR